MDIPLVDQKSLIFTNIINTVVFFMIVTLYTVWRRLGFFPQKTWRGGARIDNMNTQLAFWKCHEQIIK